MRLLRKRIHIIVDGLGVKKYSFTAMFEKLNPKYKWWKFWQYEIIEVKMLMYYFKPMGRWSEDDPYLNPINFSIGNKGAIDFSCQTSFQDGVNGWTKEVLIQIFHIVLERYMVEEANKRRRKEISYYYEEI